MTVVEAPGARVPRPRRRSANSSAWAVGIPAQLPFVVTRGDTTSPVDQGYRADGTSPWATAAACLGQRGAMAAVVVEPASGPLSVRGRSGVGCGAALVGRRAHVAEEVGFEPTVSFPTHDFQSCRFGRSRTPPERAPLDARACSPDRLLRRSAKSAELRPEPDYRVPRPELGATAGSCATVLL